MRLRACDDGAGEAGWRLDASKIIQETFLTVDRAVSMTWHSQARGGHAMSGLPPKADIRRQLIDVRFVPNAYIDSARSPGDNPGFEKR